MATETEHTVEAGDFHRSDISFVYSKNNFMKAFLITIIS